MDLSLTLRNTTFPHPVGTASGTYGYGEEYAELLDPNLLGALYTKAVTLKPRPGNPVPRLVETTAGMLNSIGLANSGLEDFTRSKLPFIRSLKCPVILNVGGSSEEEYAEIVQHLTEEEGIDGFEINISCPNVKHGGLSFGTDPVQVERLTATLRPLTKKPLILKLTPNVTDIAVIARAAENGGADAISCINTLRGMAVDIHKKAPVIPAVTAGLSGPAIKPVGLAAVWTVSKAVDIPVIGLGGISSAEDAIEYLLAGADALQVGTANFFDPQLPLAIRDGIITYMKEQGLQTIQDFHRFF